MYPIGELKPIYHELPVNQQSTLPELRPPDGVEWLILNLVMWHDMGAATAIYWFYRHADITKDIIINSGSLVATGTLAFQPYGGYQGIPMLARHDMYPYGVCAVVGGKHISIRGSVIERPEKYDLLFEEFLAHKLGFRLPISSRE